jgi:hypothetical protein
MRSPGKTDLTGLFKYYKEHVDPEFVRFETSFKSRTLTELARLATFFKTWNDDPAGTEIVVETSASGGDSEEDGTSEAPCEQLLLEQEKRLTAAHGEEIARLESQLRDSLRANDQVLAALAQNSTYDKTIAGLLERLPWTGFDTPINELKEQLSSDSRSYCRVHGILFAGELWSLKNAPAGVEQDVAALCASWSVDRSADVICQGYVPRYWLNPAFYTTCAMSVSDVLRPGEYSRRSRMESYLDPGMKVGGFLRKWKGVPGKLQDFQHCLDKNYSDAVHAGCYVPDEWTGE